MQAGGADSTVETWFHQIRALLMDRAAALHRRKLPKAVPLDSALKDGQPLPASMQGGHLDAAVRWYLFAESLPAEDYYDLFFLRQLPEATSSNEEASASFRALLWLLDYRQEALETFVPEASFHIPPLPDVADCEPVADNYVALADLQPLDEEELPVMQGRFTFFWRPNDTNGVFSNWFPARTRVDDYIYEFEEQHLMHSKALLFGDLDAAARIMRSRDPEEVKRIGREVDGFINEVWDQHKFRILVEGLTAKFESTDLLRHKLLATRSSILAEASPYDLVYGIGWASDDPRSRDQQQWRGQNLLGQALMLVRHLLFSELYSPTVSPSPPTPPPPSGFNYASDDDEDSQLVDSRLLSASPRKEKTPNQANSAKGTAPQQGQVSVVPVHRPPMGSENASGALHQGHPMHVSLTPALDLGLALSRTSSTPLMRMINQRQLTSCI